MIHMTDSEILARAAFMVDPKEFKMADLSSPTIAALDSMMHGYKWQVRKLTREKNEALDLLFRFLEKAGCGSALHCELCSEARALLEREGWSD